MSLPTDLNNRMKLQKDFNTKSHTVNKLPKVKDLKEGQNIVLKAYDGTKTLYVMNEGKLYLIGTLTEV